MILALVIGIIGALILGTGMSMCLGEIAGGMVLGVIIGCFGILICAVNYPLYTSRIKKNSKKYKGEILKLSNEILKEEK